MISTFPPGAPVLFDGVHQGGLTGRGSAAPTREEQSQAIKEMKPQLLRRLADAYKMDQCLVFCRTKLDCDNVEHYLRATGGGSQLRLDAESGRQNAYSCAVLHSDRSAGDRRAALEAFKAGRARFLVCTDVAARGIDVRELPYVINMTLPDSAEDYIHRVGRVGRADCMGLAISLVATAEELVWYHKCASRGKGCQNRRLVSEGGCVLWLNEPELFRAIETRVGKPLERLDPEALLTAGSSSNSGGARAGGVGGVGGVQYGKPAADAAEASALMLRLHARAPLVALLSSMEVKSQRAYLALRTMGRDIVPRSLLTTTDAEMIAVSRNASSDAPSRVASMKTETVDNDDAGDDGDADMGAADMGDADAPDPWLLAGAAPPSEQQSSDRPSAERQQRPESHRGGGRRRHGRKRGSGGKQQGKAK